MAGDAWCHRKTKSRQLSRVHGCDPGHLDGTKPDCSGLKCQGVRKSNGTEHWETEVGRGEGNGGSLKPG